MPYFIMFRWDINLNVLGKGSLKTPKQTDSFSLHPL